MLGLATVCVGIVVAYVGIGSCIYVVDVVGVAVTVAVVYMDIVYGVICDHGVGWCIVAVVGCGIIVVDVVVTLCCIVRYVAASASCLRC